MCCDIICILPFMCRKGNVELQDTSTEWVDLVLTSFSVPKVKTTQRQACDSPPFCSHFPVSNAIEIRYCTLASDNSVGQGFT